MRAAKPHQYQHQLYYQITPADYSALRTRLNAAVPDAGSTACVHMLRFTSYRQNLYGDTPGFTMLYYNNDPTYVILERRMGKERTSTIVAEAECRALLSGETDWLLNQPNPVLRDFHDSLTQHMLLPRVLLTFQRETYTLDDLDMWVALDTNVRSSLQHMDFLDPELLARDTADQEGELRLSISYSNTIPDDIISLFVETAPKRKPLHKG